MTTWHRKTGDVGRTIRVGLNGIGDITGAQVEGHVKRGTSKVNLTGTIVKAIADSAGPCAVDLQLGSTAGLPWLPTAAVGAWELETELTFSASAVHTWPEVGADTIIVGEQRDP